MQTVWTSVLAKNTTKLDKDWQEYAGGAQTTIGFLEDKNAQDEANSRIQIVKDYNEEHPDDNKDE